jgi:hypothetical protein
MVRLAAVVVVVAAIGLAIGGWLYMSSFTDAGAGSGWRLLYAGRGTRDLPVSVEMVHGSSEAPMAGLAKNREALAELWSSEVGSGEPPSVDFDDHVVVRATGIGSGSCPLHLDGLSYDEHAVVVQMSIGIARFWGCSGDAVPYQFVVAVDADRIAAADFRMRIRADAWSWQGNVSPWLRDS